MKTKQKKQQKCYKGATTTHLAGICIEISQQTRELQSKIPTRNSFQPNFDSFLLWQLNFIPRKKRFTLNCLFMLHLEHLDR